MTTEHHDITRRNFLGTTAHTLGAGIVLAQAHRARAASPNDKIVIGVIGASIGGWLFNVLGIMPRGGVADGAGSGDG